MAIDLSLNPFGMGVNERGNGSNFSLGVPNLALGEGGSGQQATGGVKMTPANIAVIGGLLGQAIGGDTTGGRISQVASSIGMTQLKASAAQQQQQAQLKFLKELLAKGGDLDQLTPEQAKVLGLNTNLSLGASPSGNTGLETGKMTESKLGFLNSPSLF